MHWQAGLSKDRPTPHVGLCALSRSRAGISRGLCSHTHVLAPAAPSPHPPGEQCSRMARPPEVVPAARSHVLHAANIRCLQQTVEPDRRQPPPTNAPCLRPAGLRPASRRRSRSHSAPERTLYVLPIRRTPVLSGTESARRSLKRLARRSRPILARALPVPAYCKGRHSRPNSGEFFGSQIGRAHV